MLTLLRVPSLSENQGLRPPGYQGDPSGALARDLDSLPPLIAAGLVGLLTQTLGEIRNQSVCQTPFTFRKRRDVLMYLTRLPPRSAMT
jgi:hypothetical protein